MPKPLFPAIAPSDAVYQFLLDLLREKIAKEGDVYVMADTVARVPDETFADIISFLYDTLLDWMGPGRDPAFLEMHLFANQTLPVTLSCSYLPEASGDVAAYENEVRGPSWPGAAIAFDVGEGYAVHAPLLLFNRQTADNPDFLLFAFVLVPSNAYRHDLMGELSVPFAQSRPQDNAYYHPERWTDPPVRAYDPSGRRW